MSQPPASAWVASTRVLELLRDAGVPNDFTEPFLIPNGGIRSLKRLDYDGMLRAVAAWNKLKYAPSARSDPHRLHLASCPLPAMPEWSAAALPQLREAQAVALRRCLVDGYAKSGIIDAPPGWGKTILALHMMRCVGRRVMIVTTTRTLLDQWVQHIEAAGVSCQTVGSSLRYNAQATAVLATYQTLVTARGEETKRDMLVISATVFGLLVLDEAHMLPAPNYRKIVNLLNGSINALCKIGLTGTMIREDRHRPIDDLLRLIGPINYRVTSEESESAPTVIARIVHVPMPPPIEALHATSCGFCKRLCALLNPCKLEYVSMLLARHAASKIILFVDLIKALPVVLNAIQHVLLDVPVFGPVCGGTSTARRISVIDTFREATKGVLLTTDVLALGTDIEDVSVVVELSADISRSKCIQRWGRAWRVHEGKTLAHAYTLVSRDTSEAAAAAHRVSLLHVDPEIIHLGEAAAPKPEIAEFAIAVVTNAAREANAPSVVAKKKKRKQRTCNQILPGGAIRRRISR